MKTQYVLIDYENVQPRELRLLDGQALKVIVFIGASQLKISADLATTMQRRGQDGEYIRISGNGRNALDFHIAFYLGDLAAKDPDASFHVISKDDGYDPLLSHLRAKGIDARRSETLAALLPPIGDKLGTVIAHLERLGLARPRRIKTLANTINALFGKGLDEAEIQLLIDGLAQQGVISSDGAKEAYRAL